MFDLLLLPIAGLVILPVGIGLALGGLYWFGVAVCEIIERGRQ